MIDQTFMLITIVIIMIVVLVNTAILIRISNMMLKGMKNDQPLMREHGIPKNAQFPLTLLTDVHGHAVAWKGKRTLAVLTADGCQACKELYKLIGQMKEELTNLNLLLLVDGPVEDIRLIPEKYGIAGQVIEASRDYKRESLSTTFTPFVYLLDEEGRIVSKGVTMNKLHLLTLIHDD